MRNITRKLTAVAATTALALTSIEPAYASSLSSSSGATTPPVVEPEAPVDDRPYPVRLVEAVEEHLVAEGYILDPTLKKIAQREAASYPGLTWEETRPDLQAAGFQYGAGMSISYMEESHFVGAILSWQNGAVNLVNLSGPYVGVAVEEQPDESRWAWKFVIVGASKEPPAPGEEVVFEPPNP